MYKITLAILGKRLKQVREHIKLSQVELAEKMGCKQNAISNLELGKGGSIKLLFGLLNLYSDYVYIDFIFNEKFYLISNNKEDEAQKGNYNTVIAELIRQSKTDFIESMNNSMKEHQQQLDENLQKAINLLER